MTRNPTTIYEKLVTYQFKTQHLYIILAASAILTFFFYNEEILVVPKWSTMLAFAFAFMWAFGEQWEAWRRQGAIVCTTLGIGKGSNSGINVQDDLRVAKSYKPEFPNFAVLAMGGFSSNGFSTHGHENFLVVPPEHIMQYYGNIIVKTRLRHVYYNQLPKYIQDELSQLTGFKTTMADKRRNLYFGITSSYYGTDTPDNLKFEQQLIDKVDMTNAYSGMLDDLIERKTQVKDKKPDSYDIIHVDDNK